MSSRRGSGFGMVMLVVVMAIVLLLVARSWLAVAPEAQAVSQPAIVDPQYVNEPGEMPNLHETQSNTDEHKRQVSDVLGEVE